MKYSTLILALAASLTLIACNNGSNNQTNPNNAYIGGGSCFATNLQWVNNTFYSSCQPQANYWNVNNYNALLSSSAQGNNNWGIVTQDQTGNIAGYSTDETNAAYYPYAINVNANDDVAVPTWVYNQNGGQIGNDGIDGGSVEDIPGGFNNNGFYFGNSIIANNGVLYLGGNAIAGDSVWMSDASNSNQQWNNLAPNWAWEGTASTTVDKNSGILYVLGNCGELHYYSNGAWSTYQDKTIQNSPIFGIGGASCNRPLSQGNYASSMTVTNGNLYVLLSNQSGGSSYLYSLATANPNATMSAVSNNGNTYTALTADGSGNLWAAQVMDANYDMQVTQLLTATN